MSEQDFGSTPPGPANEPTTPAGEPGWETTPQYPPAGPAAGYAQQASAGYPPPGPGYAPPQGYAPPPPGYAAPMSAGLSDNAAGALAYVTIIPAVIFLVMAPYNQKPFVKFHSIQELGLFVVMCCLSVFLVIPVLGWLIYTLGWICLLVVWVLCIMKASQGGALKLPVIGDFAAQQSGYRL